MSQWRVHRAQWMSLLGEHHAGGTGGDGAGGEGWALAWPEMALT